MGTLFCSIERVATSAPPCPGHSPEPLPSPNQENQANRANHGSDNVPQGGDGQNRTVSIVMLPGFLSPLRAYLLSHFLSIVSTSQKPDIGIFSTRNGRPILLSDVEHLSRINRCMMPLTGLWCVFEPLTREGLPSS